MATNILLSGHPQVIKLVQSTPNKNLSGIVGATNSGNIKVCIAFGQLNQVDVFYYY